MSAPALVLDVVPPPDLPPVRSRSSSRWWSVLLVTVILGLVPVLAFTPSARAFLPAVPVAAKALAPIAISALTTAGFEAMMDTPEDWGPDGPDGEQAKAKRGKWGSKLKGTPGLAVGILGGMVTLVDGAKMLMGDGADGLKMPDGFQDDVRGVLEERLPAVNGQYANWNISGVRFNYQVTEGASSWKSFIISGSCSGTGSFCPSNGVGNLNDFRLDVKCHTPGVGYWTQPLNMRINALPVTAAKIGMCRQREGDPEGQVHSIATISTKANPYVGLRNPAVFYNPDFSAEDAPEAGLTVTAEVKCRDGEGNIATFTKTVPGADVMPLISCPAGSMPESIGWTATNGATGQSEWLGGVQPKTPEAYPDCPPGQCVRIITVDGFPCQYGRAECYDWMSTEPPSRVKCEYGPYNMPLAECADLADIHKTTWGVVPEYGPDGQPKWVPARPDGTPDSTKVGTIPNWDAEENPEYRPPVPGPFVGAPPQTGPSTTPAPTPTTVPPTNPNPPVWNPPGGPKDPENPTKNCIASMASWNPVDWVYVPVKCALAWAFIPKNDFGSGAFLRFRQNFTDSGMGPWLAIPPLLFDDLPEGSGCQGPPLTMPASLGGKTYYPLNACSDPMAKYANMSRSLITVVVVFYGMFSVINSLTTSLTGYRMFERESAQVTKGMT